MSGHGNEIKRLTDDSIRRIVAEQAITDLASLVKELVDNALDAESTTIKIRLFGQGLDIVEVSDDGFGIPPESRPHIAERYATSKIASFEDIYSGTGLTMGFRGEALFSMACLSAKLVVATRTEEEDTAQKLEFDRCGNLDPASVQDIHRKVGTTVAVVQPFAALPARRADMTRRIRGERAKLFRLMESYAIFNVGVQLNLIDMSSSGREEVALATSGSSTKLEQNVSSVLGHKFLGTLSPLEISLDDMLQRDENICHWGITGLVSTNPRGDMPNRTVNYYSINGRVVEIPKITLVLRKVWNGFGGRKKPSCILSLTLPNDAFDINLSPDKQQVLLMHEQEICQLVEEQVTRFWSSQTQGVFALQQVEMSLENDDVEMDDDGERQMHKRRFAFVHDLAKARLQHDSDDRQRCVEGDEEIQVDKDPEIQRTTVHEVLNLPPQTPLNPIVNETEQPRRISSLSDATTTKTNTTPQNGNQVGLSVDRVTDMERCQWTALRSKFNSGDDEEANLRMSPISPDDHAGEETAPCYPPRKSNVAKHSCNDREAKDKPSDSTYNRKQQSSLQQFAFIPGDKPKPHKRTREPVPEPKPTATAKDIVVADDLPPRKTRRVTRSQLEMEEAALTVAQEDSTNHDAPTTRERHKSSDDDDVVTTGSVAVDHQRCTSPDLKSSQSLQQDKRSESVLWTNFTTMEEVCRSARLDRVQMLRRKLGNRRMEHTIINCQELDEEARTVVSNSVGLSGAANPSRICLSKEQFRNDMEVIGQFNMGFILAKCKNNHLWILDQHACDEKYNFEKLCRETIIHEQKLLRPMPLDLSPAEEACILDNMRIFEANGFRFEFDSNAPIRRRLSLTALPHSGARDGRKAVQFTKDDVSVLCAILADGSSYEAGDGGIGTDGTGSYGNNAVRRYASTASSQFDGADKIIARLPKAIAMFASRACRSSIMIGTALSQKEMDKIVRRLADVEQPWNCPHGRPTMRHVGHIASSMQYDERMAADYFTGPTVAITPMTQEPSSGDPTTD